MNKADWKKAFIELVGYVDRYVNNGKERWHYDGCAWTDVYDARIRKTNIMPDVVFAELAKGEWKRKYDSR